MARLENTACDCHSGGSVFRTLLASCYFGSSVSGNLKGDTACDLSFWELILQKT